MKYLLEIEVEDKKASFVEEFFRMISFVKKVKTIESNEVTNPTIMKSIEAYEKGKVNPTPLSLAELKTMINA
ncbi:hypothetical protein QEG73_18510 [Chitinophagaceae bacterium 26-R-25]|nr:hypothetical protein [Chitinophagaceae bacterium 26-R-25]